MALWCVEPCHVRVFFAATRCVPYSSFSSRFHLVLSVEEGFSSEGVVPASAPMDLFDAWSTNCSVLALLLGFDPDCVAIVSSFCPDILRYTRQGRSDAFLLERSLAASSALLSGHNFAPSWSAGTLTTVIEASAA